MHSFANFRKNVLEVFISLINTKTFALARPVSCIKASWKHAYVVALCKPQLSVFK